MNVTFNKGWELFDTARELIPFGTGTHSKAPTMRGQEPAYYVRGQGARVWDIDGNEFIDYRNALGPITLGYCYEPVQRAIGDQLTRGTVFSAPHPLEVELARKITKLIPAAQMVRYLKTGGEAMAAAIRLARAFTGRELVLTSGYHGWLQNEFNQKGVLDSSARQRITYTYGDLKSLEHLLEEHRGRVAAVTLSGDYALMREGDPFPAQLRAVTRRHDVLLVLDEIVTGFRLAINGFHGYYGIEPDLAVVSKGIANGMPLSVFFGRRDIMSMCETNPVISSTFSGEILSLAAAVATLEVYRTQPVIQHMWTLGRKLMEGMSRLFYDHDVPMKITGLPPCAFLGIEGADAAAKARVQQRFFAGLYARGIAMYLVPYISYSLTASDVDHTLECIDEVCREMRDTKHTRTHAAMGAQR